MRSCHERVLAPSVDIAPVGGMEDGEIAAQLSGDGILVASWSLKADGGGRTAKGRVNRV